LTSFWSLISFAVQLYIIMQYKGKHPPLLPEMPFCLLYLPPKLVCIHQNSLHRVYTNLNPSFLDPSFLEWRLGCKTCIVYTGLKTKTDRQTTDATWLQKITWPLASWVRNINHYHIFQQIFFFTISKKEKRSNHVFIFVSRVSRELSPIWHVIIFWSNSILFKFETDLNEFYKVQY
jgi:hypothetical protein